MILERIKSLLIPRVSPDAKVSGIALFLGKTLDQFGGRTESLESCQLERGEKGDSIIGPAGPQGVQGKHGTTWETKTLKLWNGSTWG